jgi:hypothetical protein
MDPVNQKEVEQLKMKIDEKKKNILAIQAKTEKVLSQF